MPLNVWSGVHYRTVATGVFHCERCGGDRPYRHRSGRRWAHLLGLPVMPLGRTGEHLSCAMCRTCYRVELLAVPTIEQMSAALVAATTAASLAMLAAGGSASQAARRRAIEMIIDAGSARYGEAELTLALEGAGGRQVSGVRAAVEMVAIQLEAHATEWFLANVVHVGLADGRLSDAERAVVGMVADCLGLSQERANDVIVSTEEAAQAG